MVRFYGNQGLIKEKISEGVYFPTKEQALQAAVYDMYKPTMKLSKIINLGEDIKDAFKRCETMEGYLEVINKYWNCRFGQVQVEKLIPAKISASDLDDLTVELDNDIHGRGIEET